MPNTPVVYDGPLPQLEIVANGIHNSPREEAALTGSSSTIPPSWGSWAFSSGEVGVAYDYQFDMPSADRPITYSVLSGTLPAGLSLNATGDGHSANISGTPTTAGTSSFTLRAVNPAGTADQAFSIVIRPSQIVNGCF